MRSTIVKFGLLSGLVLAAEMAATIPFQSHGVFSMVVGYTTMVLAFLLVYFGVRSYRDTVAGGTIGFGRAFLVGFGIAAVASVCYVAAWLVMSHFFIPDFAAKYAASAIERARASGATPEQLAAKTREMADFQRAYSNPFIVAAYTFLEPLPVALVMSLLSAALLSRRAPKLRGAAVASSLPAI